MRSSGQPYVGVAIVGAGHWGPHLARNFDEDAQSRVLWIIEKDEKRRTAVEQRFWQSNVTSDVSSALSDPAVSAVVIATPTQTHFEVAKEALQAGKHVLVEKPITHSLETARELCLLASTKELVLMVGHVFLFNHAVIAAKELMYAGKIGRPRYLSMTRTNLGPVRTDVNAAWDLASHDVSIANYLLQANPIGVNASSGSWLNDGVDDVVVATLRYPRDVLVHIEASWLHPRKKRLVTVVGDERMLTIDDMELTEPHRIYDKGVLGDDPSDVTDTFGGFRSQIREGEVVIPPVTAGEPLRSECQSFIRRILGDNETVSDGWAGADVVAVIEAIDRSVALGGGHVEVTPAR